MSKDNIQPLKGFRDFLPEEMAERQKVFGKIRTVFEKYGFLPMGTPVLEYKEVLAGKYGEEGDRLMYQFEDRGGRGVALRYDLTVPLARYIASNYDKLSFPFKRYEIGMMWRADKPQKGRYREFYQCDVDVVGSNSILADAEVIVCLNETLNALGVTDCVVRVNNRKLLLGILAEAEVREEDQLAVVRALDKLERDGEDAVRGELAAAGVQTEAADKLFELISTSFQDVSDFVAKFEGIDGAGELAELLEALLAMGVQNYQVDLTLARGMDYYTGTIFEFVLPDAADFGSIAGGGRYDNLLGMFRGEDIPSVGGSIGVDRLLAALEELELIKYDLIFDVLVVNLNEELTEKYLGLVRTLRGKGIMTDFYYESDKLDRQLKYADRKNINFVLLLGPDEDASGEVQVKNMSTGSQEAVSRDDLADYLLSKIENND